MRLRSLTERIAGDTRPKQFCPLFDGETLLDRTRRRADLAIRPDHQAVVVSASHRPYYASLARELAPGRLVEQPVNRGTAPGILYPLLRVHDLAGDVPVAVLPSDHDVAEDHAFMSYVQAAVDMVAGLGDRVVLLGIEADYPEREYGWIEPTGYPLPIEGEATYGIRRFWEKPSPRLAEALYERGCLWNSFVMVGRISAFLGLVREARPALLAAFEPVMNALGTEREARAVDEVYAGLDTVGFSEHVLARVPHLLRTIRAKDVGWSDWGNPTRVLSSLRRSGRRPGWLSRIELASTA